MDFGWEGVGGLGVFDDKNAINEFEGRYYRKSQYKQRLSVIRKKNWRTIITASEAVLLELTEEEQEMKTNEVANRKCPGFSYCMEMYLVQEMMRDLDTSFEKMDMDKKVDRVIYYIEYDA